LPTAPVLLSPAKGAEVQESTTTSAFTFTWTALVYSDYGLSCQQQINPQLAIFVDTSPFPTTQLDTLFYDQSVYEVLASQFSPGTVMYWRIEAQNGFAALFLFLSLFLD